MGRRDVWGILRLRESVSDFTSSTTDCLAQVRHPYVGVGSELVAKELASLVGVVVLPGSFFNPPFDDIREDHYLRFCESYHRKQDKVLLILPVAIANVRLDKLRLVPARLRKLDEMWSSLSS